MVERSSESRQGKTRGMKYYYKTLKRISVKNTNCLFFSIWYVITKRRGYIWAEFDSKLCYWHFYIRRRWYEIHLEQNNRKTEKWTPFLDGYIKIYYQYQKANKK